MKGLKLKHLQLKFMCCGVRSLEHLAAGMSGLSQLRHSELIFSFCSELGNVHHLSEGLVGLKNLQRLELNFMSCRHVTSLHQFAQRLRGLQQLQVLKLNFICCSLSWSERHELQSVVGGMAGLSEPASVQL